MRPLERESEQVEKKSAPNVASNSGRSSSTASAWTQTLQLWLGFDDPSLQCAVVDFSSLLVTDQELRCQYPAHVSLYSHVQQSEYWLDSIIT